MDNAIGFTQTYPLDSDLSGGQHSEMCDNEQFKYLEIFI